VAPRFSCSLAYQLRVLPVIDWPSTKPVASLWALFSLTVTGVNAWLWDSAYAVAVTLLMAKANNAVLLSFMGEAPCFLFLCRSFFGDPAIWLEHI
jgi:hypothetical protein